MHMNPRIANPLPFEATVKLQLNPYRIVLIDGWRNCLQLLKNPWKSCYTMDACQSPPLGLWQTQAVWWWWWCVCVWEREMETFLASLLNLSTSYRELWRNALFFSTFKWVWIRMVVLQDSSFMWSVGSMKGLKWIQVSLISWFLKGWRQRTTVW